MKNIIKKIRKRDPESGKECKCHLCMSSQYLQYSQYYPSMFILADVIRSNVYNKISFPLIEVLPISGILNQINEKRN